VRGGRICRIDLPVPMPSPLPLRAPASTPASSTGGGSQGPIFPGVTAWEELTLLDIDDRTILVRFRQRERRVTARDLGLAFVSSGNPLIPFDLLHAFCASGGRFKSWRFGNARSTKVTLSRLRTVLCERFGLPDDPFNPYRRGVGWVARFRVGDARAEREDALSAGARGVLERAGKLGKR